MSTDSFAGLRRVESKFWDKTGVDAVFDTVPAMRAVSQDAVCYRCPKTASWQLAQCILDPSDEMSWSVRLSSASMSRMRSRPYGQDAQIRFGCQASCTKSNTFI